ncbi:hypothetical protein GVN21_19515 [Caulobacter sp. SLTY]|uniref:tape measure protein n=1 Tax=Caulobacter sp. SLTY TaxID=2683262 RepID=UPI00141315D5|nr:tape measure protein [Caulobacter sp. SLTY]NBB17556.1 hypothetical protein [Caulobacter sp. SLTY]
MTDLSLSLVLKTLDRGATPGLRKFRAEVKGLSSEVKATPVGWLQAASANARATDAQKRWNDAGRQGNRTLDQLIDRQRRLRAETHTTAAELRADAQRSRAALGGWLGATAGLGASMAVGGSIAFGKSVIDTSARFESYEATLRTINEGNTAKAREEMGWIQTFAKTTPYDIDQVTEAFVKLKAYGIEPTDGTLKTLGNTASGMNKQVMDAVEALADAQTGEFERLKEFGVRAKVQGDRVTFTYVKAGKEMQVTTKKSATAIQKSLLGIFDARFKGAMDEQSRTWNGMVSNLGDTWTGFQKRVADKGLFDKVKGSLGELLNFLGEAEKDGRLDKWAGEIAGSLGQVADSMVRVGKAVDWVGLARDIGKVAGAVATLVEKAQALDKFLGGGRPEGAAQRYDIGSQWEATMDYLREKRGRRMWANPGGADALETLRNPWAAGPSRAAPSRRVVGDNRPMPGLGGGPLQQRAPKGRLEIGLAPGLVIKDTRSDDFDFTRRGGAGERP